MPEVHVVRVFVNEHGQFGDLASTIFDIDGTLDNATRQKLTRQIGHAETVFVNDEVKAQVSIFNPQQEVKFAGAPLVGTAWLLGNLSATPIDTIHCQGGDVHTWQAGDITWIQTRLDMMPPWQFIQLDVPQEVEEFPGERAKILEHTVIWAWLDEPQGVIHARTFAPDWDIPEAEANGSGSMLLAAKTGRKLEIRHGQGSVCYAEPNGSGLVSVGGRVVEDITQAIST